MRVIAQLSGENFFFIHDRSFPNIEQLQIIPEPEGLLGVGDKYNKNKAGRQHGEFISGCQREMHLRRCIQSQLFRCNISGIPV